MLKKIIDISLPLTADLPVWPGNPRFERVQVSHLGVDECNETQLILGSHTGTHIDAPRHFVENGDTVDQIPLEVLVGEACVAECMDTKAISADAGVMFVIGFENDTPGSKFNGFQSVDSDIVTFTDSVGGFTDPPGTVLPTDGLFVGDFNERTFGQGLAVLAEDDDSAVLVMDFSTPVNFLSVSFGNDTFGQAISGEKAVLTAFQSGVQVGQTELELNLNGVIDQTIEILGVGSFDQATFKFEVDPVRGLIEMVDNITFGVPEPTSAVSLILLAAWLRPLTRRE